MTGGESVSVATTYVELFEHPGMKDLKNVTFETNTTQLPQTSKNYPSRIQDRFEVAGLSPNR